MGVRLDKDWIPLTAAHVDSISGHLGVYELASTAGEIVYIGVAGGRSRYGLRGELLSAVECSPFGAVQFRFEANMAYHTRQIELLLAYRHDHGCLPVGNTDIDERHLGHLRLG